MLVTYITAKTHAIATKDSMIGPNNTLAIDPTLVQLQHLQLYDRASLTYVSGRT